MSEPPKKSFSEMRRELARQRGRTLPEDEEQKTPLHIVPSMPEEFIPDVLGDRSEEDLEIDGIIESIEILDAYRRWIGKEVNEKETSKREGLHVSCPNPHHRDKNPSAFINQDKKLWRCELCDDGGDVYDLAAIKFGYDRPGYKDGKTFYELRLEMAESYGYRVKKISGKTIVWKEEPEPDPSDQGGSSAEPEDKASEEEPSASVTVLHDKDVEDEATDQINYPSLDWREFVPHDTFLRKYMDACCNDDAPEEYHFWHGLLALGHAVGRKVYFDDSPNVYGNLLVCLLGGTGYGKSRSRRWLNTVLRGAVPWNENAATGCKLAPVAASGENLIAQFEYVAADPTNPKGPGLRLPVNGIVDYSEFSALLARAARMGASLKQTIMDLHDGFDEVSTSSNTGGTRIAVEPFCSITTTTQPKAVRPLLSRFDASSGFLNRWLFVGGPKKKREVLGGTRSKIQVNLDPAIEELKRIRAWGAASRSVWFDAEATAEAFKEYILTVVDPIRLRDETEMLTRLELTMKRLVLLFAINERKTEITMQDLDRLKPILDYLVVCYGILSAEIGITQIQEISSELLRHIRNIEEKTGRGASARDLGLRMKRKNYSPDLIKKALDTMIGLDWIDIEKPEKKSPGRPTLRYKVVGE